MAWLAISGIDLSAIAATVSDPKGPRRDIGDISPANDGTLRATRQSRKHDLSIQSIPLAGADAFAWESLLVGEGNVWSFDSSYYSSKGLPSTPSNAGATSVQATTKKYGAGALHIASSGQTMTSVGLGLASVPNFTWAVWWNQNLAGWHHYAQRSDGKIWVDGVRNDSAFPLPFVYSAGEAALLTNTASDFFDDWVVTPYLWPLTWAPLVYASGAAFSPLPYLTCAGDLVREATSRTMIGKVSVTAVKRANPAGTVGAAAKDVQVLQVDLQEK
jgi:hypothetical protein